MGSEKNDDLLISALYSHLLEIENAIPAVAYKFTPDEEYLKLINISEIQLLYWGEIIQRLHICSSTTIFRLRKWYDAMEVAYKATNYYGFCSAVRGLLEACSDSFATLGTVIFPIAGVYMLYRKRKRHEKPNIACIGCIGLSLRRDC